MVILYELGQNIFSYKFNTFLDEYLIGFQLNYLMFIFLSSSQFLSNGSEASNITYSVTPRHQMSTLDPEYFNF